MLIISCVHHSVHIPSNLDVYLLTCIGDIEDLDMFELFSGESRLTAEFSPRLNAIKFQ